MKKIVLLGIILLSVFGSSAQRIRIQKQKSLLYITHKVTAKETLYSLGRTYNISPKEIAKANQLKTDAGIQVGQQVKIPLKKDNFIQSNTQPKGAAPVYHTIKKGENLFKVSRNYNNVKESLIKKWNHLSKSTVKPGQELVIGYVKLTSGNVPEEKKEMAAAKPKVVPVTIEDAMSSGLADETAPQPRTPDTTSTGNQAKQKIEINTAQATISDEGFFAANYSINAANAQEKKITGTSATFKSTSGWSDKKYYILTNGISPETIVKVTANGKSVYAKVLESLPELKDNNGLVCRLSNATASALGISNPKFDVEISFYE